MQLFVERKTRFYENYFLCHCADEGVTCEIREELSPDIFRDLENLVVIDSGIVEITEEFYEEIFTSSIQDDRFNQKSTFDLEEFDE